MAKILKNNTGSNVFISDVGQTVPASGQLTISPSDYDKYAESSNIITLIGDSTLTVNDGSVDLNISEATDLIKGSFPKSIQTNLSVLSTLNSTSTLLNAGQTFTGTWEEIIKFSTISITVFTSHISAVNGLKYQTSTDGVNWDDGDLFTIHPTTAGNAKTYTFGVTTRYFRIVYENGASNQTTFRLQTILHSFSIKNSSHRVDDSIVDDDDAELVKSIITGKSYVSGDYKNITTDEEGRILTSDQSELLSPLPSIRIVERRVLASGSVYAFTQTISQDTAIKEVTFGGRGPGEGMFGKYTASTEDFVPNGNFESSGEVSAWTSTGIGDGAALVPTYSTTQAFTGTGSLRLGPGTRSDSNHYPQVTYTWPTPVSGDLYRYISARFYNDPPAGGAVTRTISIRLQDTNGVIRVYSVSGLTNVAPFNAAGWIQILGEIRVPTSEVGSGFDINNISSISLRMQDSGNKTFTAIYWDTVKFIGALDIIQKLYTNGNTIDQHFDPVVVFNSGDIMYLALRNNDTVSREYQLTVAGVDIS